MHGSESPRFSYCTISRPLALALNVEIQPDHDGHTTTPSRKGPSRLFTAIADLAQTPTLSDAGKKQ